MSELMLDLETGDRSCNARVFQVALCSLEKSDIVNVTGPKFVFNQYISIDSRGVEDPETMTWWRSQGAAWDKLQQELKTGMPLRETVEGFLAWWETINSQDEVTRLWSYGASFDIPIWQTAIERAGFKKPWSYKIERCLRTADDLLFEGLQHDAMADALDQADRLNHKLQRRNRGVDGIHKR